MIGMEKEAPSGAMEMCVPSRALAVDGTAPAEGDEVEFTVKGKCRRTEGENTYVEPETINGEEVGKPEESPEDNSDEDMMKKAQESDDHDQASITA